MLPVLRVRTKLQKESHSYPIWVRDTKEHLRLPFLLQHSWEVGEMFGACQLNFVILCETELPCIDHCFISSKLGLEIQRNACIPNQTEKLWWLLNENFP